MRPADRRTICRHDPTDNLAMPQAVLRSSLSRTHRPISKSLRRFRREEGAGLNRKLPLMDEHSVRTLGANDRLLPYSSRSLTADSELSSWMSALHDAEGFSVWRI